METMMVAELILSPFGLIICIFIPTITIVIARRPQLSASRLVAGYMGALFALAVVVGASSYVSPQDAVSIWHIPPERYWDSLVELFLGTFVVAAFASIVGISFVGIPVLVALSNSGRATAPWLIIASAVISTVMAIIAYLLMHSSSNMTFLGTLGLLVLTF
jgi:NAD/NADP transhydrogenase beta subunit